MFFFGFPAPIPFRNPIHPIRNEFIGSRGFVVGWWQDPGLRIASFIAAEGGEVGDIFHDPKNDLKNRKKEAKEGGNPMAIYQGNLG